MLEAELVLFCARLHGHDAGARIQICEAKFMVRGTNKKLLALCFALLTNREKTYKSKSLIFLLSQHLFLSD